MDVHIRFIEIFLYLCPYVQPNKFLWAEMKKLFVLTAALLLSLLAHSQEADGSAPYTDLTLVARAEYSSVEDGYHLGNSCFYALLDGAFSPNLSYSIETHLLSPYLKDLYTATTYSNFSNWLDWAYLQYDFGQFGIRLGKDAMMWGTFENQKYDFDCFYELTTFYWNEVSTYQWGGSLLWTPSEHFNLRANISTSPFGEHFFSSGLWQYSLGGEVNASDWFEGIFSFNFIETPDVAAGKTITPMFSKGVKFTPGNWAVTWDTTALLNSEFADFMMNSLEVEYTPFDNFSAMAKTSFLGKEAAFTGLALNWNPWEFLRVHALVSYQHPTKETLFNIGVTWKITL